MEKSFFEEKVNYNGISALDEVKSYTHFDAKISMKKCWDYISDPKKVATHSFFPFIRFEQVFEKYVLKDKKNDEREKKFKTREICYASHIDGCIYTYYAAELNEKYNQALLDAGIDSVKSDGTRHSSVVAYRDVLEGQSNINFAHDAIQFIRQIKDCMVIIGDFKSFFDRLNHAYLKKQIKNILQVEELSEDWYAVFKSITKYSYVDLSQLMFRLCVAGESSFKELYVKNIKHDDFDSSLNLCINERDAVACGQADYKSIQKFAGANKIVKNEETINCYKGHCTNRFCYKAFNTLNKIDITLARENGLIKYPHRLNDAGKEERMGIPQGSAISAVLANVYMFEFDKAIFNYINKLGGKYMRYSDDFIITLPRDDKFPEHLEFLQKTRKDAKVGLEDKKTKIFEVNLDDEIPIKSCSKLYLNKGEDGKNAIDYLGFTFDGKDVTIKAKTIFKYYYRMYSKIKYIKLQREKGKEKVGTANLYKNYSSKNFTWQEDGDDELTPTKKNRGNFLTYIKRVKEVFVEDKEIDTPVRHHLSKIATRLNSKD